MLKVTVMNDAIMNDIAVFTADAETQRELEDAYFAGGYPAAELAVAEALRGEWEFIRPEDIGAMTDSPLLARSDTIVRDDEGNLVEVGRVAWFPDYAMHNPWMDLIMHGRVTFELV